VFFTIFFVFFSLSILSKIRPKMTQIEISKSIPKKTSLLYLKMASKSSQGDPENHKSPIWKSKNPMLTSKSQVLQASLENPEKPVQPAGWYASPAK